MSYRPRLPTETLVPISIVPMENVNNAISTLHCGFEFAIIRIVDDNAEIEKTMDLIVQSLLN